MKFRTTLILMIVLVVLGAFVLFYERKLPAPDDAESTPEPTAIGTVLAFTSADVQSVRVIRYSSTEESESTEDSIELVLRDSGLWYIISPVTEEADQDRVAEFIDMFAALVPDRVLENASSPSDYGLEPADMAVELEMKDGTVHKVNIGALTPAGSGYYGQIEGDARIYIFSYSLQYYAANMLDDVPIAPTATPTEALETPTPEVTPTGESATPAS